MPLEVERLHLASLRGLDGREWPVHGFVVTHPGGAVLVDTGCGGPDEWLDDWRVVNRSVADAHAACYVQRAELDRAKRESRELYDWFGFMNARWELLDGDTEILPGLSVVSTPGHTVGHRTLVSPSPTARTC